MIHSPFEIGNFDFAWLSQANPIAGAQLNISVPDNARSELVALSFTLTCDANVADRFVRIVVISGGLSITIGCAEFALTANEVRRIIVNSCGHSSVADGGEGVIVAIPTYPLLLEGDQFSTSILNLQATDQISAVKYVFKTWIYEQ